ncbi:MAG: hypothetical protein V3S64_02100 [bacterium]
MTENQPWICPSCGKAYPVPPKHCGCEPYPMAPPSSAFVLARREQINVDEGLGYIETSGGLSLDADEMRGAIEFLQAEGIAREVATHAEALEMPVAMTWLGDFERTDGLTEADCLLGEIYTEQGVETLSTDTLIELPLTEDEYKRLTERIEAARGETGK